MTHRCQPSRNTRVEATLDELERGREHYRLRAWAAAHRSLVLAAQAAPLPAEDLERLAIAAYLAGRDDDYLDALERSYRFHVDGGATRPAARSAFWLGLRLLFRGDIGRATGWFARARRSLELEGQDCAEHGYLMLPLAEQRLAAGDCEAAYAAATGAAEIGERCEETDLIACARHVQGRARIRQGQVGAGLALLDEAMVAVVAGEVSPIMTGLIYCSVIDACRQVLAASRCREWTAALSRWCEGQPELVAFTGVCRVHRSEIMQLQGDWQAALEEAQHAWLRSRGVSRQAAAAALYQQAEVYRLRGEFGAAEEAYRSASRAGVEPQPGLALLRMAQGRSFAAAAAIRRAASGATEPFQRIKLLPALVEIMLAVDDLEQARRACAEIEEQNRSLDGDAPAALAAEARGAVDLAEGDARAALISLRRAFEAWQRLEAPYPAARVRVLAGIACRELGDEEGAELELAAAEAVFAELGAAPDLARVESLCRKISVRPHGLTSRELQVLRLIAAGMTNKAIARELSLSEKTVDRHVGNLYRKLDVSSRSQATAYACRHGLA